MYHSNGRDTCEGCVCRVRGCVCQMAKYGCSLPSNKVKGKGKSFFELFFGFPLLYSDRSCYFLFLLGSCNPVHVFVMPPQQVKPSSGDIICWIIHKTQSQMLNTQLWQYFLTLTATNTSKVIFQTEFLVRIYVFSSVQTLISHIKKYYQVFKWSK